MRTALSVLYLTIAILAAGCASAPPPVERQTSYPTGLEAWVALTSQGALARAIVTDPQGKCPVIEVSDGAAPRPLPMLVRAGRDGDFKVLVCEAALPRDVRSARIDGTPLPLLPSEVHRIAVIGDTGCRIKCSDQGCDVQACNDPKEWPFAQVAERVAKERPDVVIHVGDYHYREAPCPADQQAKCGGSPYGDTWPAWQADFFAPAAPLLHAAPWVFVRGNHEDCQRAGGGWFRLLDPGPLPASCNEDPEPYAVEIPGLQFLVLNTSAADATSPPDYAKAYEELNGLAAGYGPSWLLSHHPLWALLESSGQLIPLTQTLQTASNNTLDKNVQLVLAGHIHLFEALGFNQDVPRVPSVVAGMSGTKLDPPITKPLVGQTIAGATVSQASTTDRFAYAIFEPKDSGWRMTVHDVEGKPVMVCEIVGATAECKTEG
jgi:predicted phosphodiesterase